MSFYGQMRWGDFQKFFYNFSLTNKNFTSDIFNEKPEDNDTEPTVTSDKVYHLQPNEDFSTFQVNMANHWIKACARDSVGDEGKTYTGFSLFHNKPQTTNLHYSQIITVTDEEDIVDDVIELGSGTCFKVQSPKFDRAGHQAGVDKVDEKFFKIPVQKIQVNQDFLELNDKGYFHFLNDDDWVKVTLNEDSNNLTFSHAVPEDFEGRTIVNFAKESESATVDDDDVLEPGDKFSSYSIAIDDAGHVTKLEKVYFQLPVDKIDEQLALLTARVDDLEISEKDHEDRITAIENAKYGTKIAELQNIVYSSDKQITDFRTAVAQLVGESVSQGVESRTVAKALTDMSNYIRSTLTTMDTELKNLREEFVEKEETDEMAVMRNAIAKLDDRLAVVEKQLGIS